MILSNISIDVLSIHIHTLLLVINELCNSAVAW